MSKTLSILVVSLLISGCITNVTTLGTKPKPTIRTIVKQCPQDPPPRCPVWEKKDKSSFEYNTDLEADRLDGQAIYGECFLKLEAYREGWNACPKG